MTEARSDHQCSSIAEQDTSNFKLSKINNLIEIKKVTDETTPDSHNPDD